MRVLPPNRNIIVDVCPAGVLSDETSEIGRPAVCREAAILDFTKDIQDLTCRLVRRTAHAPRLRLPSILLLRCLGGVPALTALCGLNEIKRKLTNLQVAVAEVAAEQA